MVVSAELKRKVDMKLAELRCMVNRRYKVDVPVHRVTYEIPKKPTTAGTAYWFSGRINLNPRYLAHYEDDFINRTVIHEYAHLVTRAVYPKAKQSHGPEFRSVMRFFDAPTETYHSYSSEPVADLIAKKTRRTYKTYQYSCSCRDNIILTSIRHNKIQRNGGSYYLCGRCNSKLKFVKQVG